MRFFPFYGSKTSVIGSYPKPKYDTIIEPFAGSATYACLYPEKQVVLVDADVTIAGLWTWLVKASSADILSLPLSGDPGYQEARSLIGFWMNHATTSPRLSPGSWMRSGIRPNSFWGPVVRQMIANQLPKIRHWKVVCGSYSEAENREATWFVDPPYIGPPGRAYRCQVRSYDRLGEWCRERHGQVIVCEQEGATWLPFKPHISIRTHSSYNKKPKSAEVIWTND